MIFKEAFEEFLKKLQKASKENIVLVEGIKDKRALASLGIQNIMTLKKPMYAVVEDIVASGKGCILLTDLDKKGKELYSRLSSKLKHFGVTIDNSFREFLFRTKLRQIEGITHYRERMK